jgi:uncharacterized protein YjbJ (UPF0337 family)
MLTCAMKRSTRNQIKGRGRELKGNIKEKTGRAMNRPDMEAEGALERIGGKVQKKAGDVEKRLDEDLEEENE